MNQQLCGLTAQSSRIYKHRTSKSHQLALVTRRESGILPGLGWALFVRGVADRRIQEDGKLLAEAFRDLEAREPQPHWPVCFRVAADMLERERAKPSRYWTHPVLRRKRATPEDQAERKPVHRAVGVL